ncbi:MULTISPECIES: hypothetical protein [unclassified Francisella]|uniref:hypothetical protein n=1 Tax=unclassified Francisella TaxID=2610885 RepID=UPI002E3318F0|nr:MULTISPECIES: hypothetical protein [unclassified Francisella]MED7819782.1 hypothetical protein [Francisella sp. 19S2-4]MED7830602.1 hypothetical protein [Francisella sp. 19S2-10]
MKKINKIIILLLILPIISFAKDIPSKTDQWGNILKSNNNYSSWGNKTGNVKIFQLKFDPSKEYLIETYPVGYQSYKYHILSNEKGAIAFVLKGKIKEEFFEDKNSKAKMFHTYEKGDYFIIGNDKELLRRDTVVGNTAVELAVVRY